MINGNFPAGGSEKINSAELMEVLTNDSIQAGDTVYVNGFTMADIKANAAGKALNNTVYSAVFSPDGKLMVIVGAFAGYAKLYEVSENAITYLSDIYLDSYGTLESAAFSPDGSLLVIGGAFTGYAKLYNVNGKTITYVSDIYSNSGTGSLNSIVYTVEFSPDGRFLVLGGRFVGCAKLYSVSGNTVTYLSEIYADAFGAGFTSTVRTASFSLDGRLLVIGGAFDCRAKLYSVSVNTVTYRSDITGLNNTVYTATFSPDGNLLVLCGYFDGKAKLYSVSGNSASYRSDIKADASGTALSANVFTTAFSPDGNLLVLGGAFTGKAKLYNVQNDSFTYHSDIKADASGTALSANVFTSAFTPDGTKLVLGGEFTGKSKLYSVSKSLYLYKDSIKMNATNNLFVNVVRTVAFSPDGRLLVVGGGFLRCAKLYSVNGNSITYLSDIDSGAAPFSSDVFTATFSPDGTKLVLGGLFPGFAKMYSVNGNTVTYLYDIKANASGTVLDLNVIAATFSPDGRLLVLGGDFAGGAKLYSVSGNTVTYLADFYKDANDNEISGSVRTATFSPDGTKLVLGGVFSGFAKLYSIIGNQISFVSNIVGTTPLGNNVYCAAFSPDGSWLVIGGDFTGKAKLFYMNGTSVTYVSDIYWDASNTTVLDSMVLTATFSPDGNLLALGGRFIGHAKLYSMSENDVTYLYDLKNNFGNTAISGAVNTAAFSPDGSNLVLGGELTFNAIQHNLIKTISYTAEAYRAPDGVIKTNLNEYGVGYAKGNIPVGGTGKVKLIGTVKKQ